MAKNRCSLERRIAGYRRTLSKYCNKRTRPILAYYAQHAVDDVRTGGGVCLDAAYCKKIGLAPPEHADRYSIAEALHMVLVTPEYHPDLSELKGKLKPEAICAALGLSLLAEAQRALQKERADRSFALLEQVEGICNLLPSSKRVRAVRKSPSELRLIRSSAVKSSKRYQNNKARREYIESYVEGVKNLLLDDATTAYSISDIARIATMAVSSTKRHYQGRNLSAGLSSEDKKYLDMLTRDLLQQFNYELNDMYLRKVIKSYLSAS